MAAPAMSLLFDGIDDASARMIIQLQLEDSASISASLRNERDGAGIPDEVVPGLLAVMAFEEDMKRNASVLDDRRLALRIAGNTAPRVNARHVAAAAQVGVLTDGAVREQLQRVETSHIAEPAPVGLLTDNTANNEIQNTITRIAAPEQVDLPTNGTVCEQLIGSSALHVTSLGILDDHAQTNTTLRTTASEPVELLKNGSAIDRADAPAFVAPSNIVALIPEAPPLPRFACTACGDSFVSNDIVIFACEEQHAYCFDCLTELFNLSFRDEELYPPRCCKELIPLAALGTHLTLEIEVTFLAKGIEYGTKDRVYCSGNECGAFLAPGMLVTPHVAQCLTCRTKTCTICKSKAHEGDCPEDEASNQLQALAESKGWKRCPGCQRMVELAIGCYHISCPCKMQFCYNCGAYPWRACECPLFDQNRLFPQANNAVRVRNRANGIICTLTTTVIIADSEGLTEEMTAACATISCPISFTVACSARCSFAVDADGIVSE
ncbi:hypothetical protein VTL71DRAFT_5078 [Oculimacula yallundae]|uniref:RBR-type E3 ubiquitin transferase n=1 Tax=Oculimacula yallundae TaxID=86028 RepID=A0ABR4C038_9HELO